MRFASWLAVLAVVFTSWLAPRVTRACSCMMPPPPAEAMERADAVFEARPFSMTNNGVRARYRFEVDQVWKGDVGPRVEISTSMSSAACGRTYRIGTRYVIYARRGSDGGWTDGLCSRTRTSQSAAEDLQVFGPGRRPGLPDPEPGSGGDAPTEPPRIDNPPPEPPPTTPSARGCAVEKPHAPGSLAGLFLLGLTVAIGRRRTVRSDQSRGR
ncbi:MAG: hypothetical protein AAF799_15110 [Myxococcota bacterium]